MSLGRSAEAPPGGLTGTSGARVRSRVPDHGGMLPPGKGRSFPSKLVSAVARGTLDDLTAILFPSDCRVCAAPLLTLSRAPVCELCLGSLQPQTAALCRICGESLGMEGERFLLARGAAEQVCTHCRVVPPAFARAVAYGVYEGELRELLQLLKYGGVRSVARPLGDRLAQSLAQLAPEFEASPAAVLVVPVPLFRPKARERGYNQAGLLAEHALASLRRRRPQHRLALAPRVLLRVKPTASQFGLNPRQRRENLRGAFAVPEPKLVLGRTILLIDDIFTTGATARACATVLRRAGAETIYVATLARAQPEGVALWDGGPAGIG